MLSLALLIAFQYATDATLAATPACPPPRAHALVSDTQASVYWFPHRGETGMLEGSEAAACARGHHGLPVREIFGFGYNVPPCDKGCLRKDWRQTVVLAGSVLAYAEDSDESSKYGHCFCEEWHVAVRDLRTGRFIYHLATGPHRGNKVNGDQYVGVGPAVSLVAKPDGAVAWMTKNTAAWWNANFGAREGEYFPNGRQEIPIQYELHVRDRRGLRVLAAGHNLETRSLALLGSTLRWTQAGIAHSAHLS
jgi:hypothetical protein